MTVIQVKLICISTTQTALEYVCETSAKRLRRSFTFNMKVYMFNFRFNLS